MEADFSYCARCGHALIVEEVHGRLRPRCPDCGHIVFLDPKLAAVVLVAIDGKLLLVRRANEPALGEWSFPSGYVDRGEAVEDAAAREVREETGLIVKVTRLLGVYSRARRPRGAGGLRGRSGRGRPAGGRRGQRRGAVRPGRPAPSPILPRRRYLGGLA